MIRSDDLDIAEPYTGDDEAIGVEVEPRRSWLHRLVRGRTEWRLCSLAVILSAWQIAVHREILDPVMVAAPSEIAVRGWEMLLDGTLIADISASMRRILVGFVAGASAGILLGYLTATYRRVEDSVEYTVQSLRTISPLALVPLTLLWFGLGETQKYFLIAYTVFFPVFISVQSAFRSVPESYIRAARTLGCHGQFETFRRVVFPSVFPRVMDGLRVGMSIGFLVIVAAEMIAAREGIGYRILQAGRVFNTTDVFVAIVTVGILGVLVDRILILLRRRLAPWYEERVAQ